MFHLTEIIALIAGALTFGITVYFFIISTRRLSKTLKESKQKLGMSSPQPHWQKAHLIPEPLPDLQQPKFSAVNKGTSPDELLPKKPDRSNQDTAALHPATILSIKDVALRQQETLKSLLKKIDDLEAEAGHKNLIKARNSELEEEVEKLNLELEVKETEIRKLKQQEGLTLQMSTRIDEVYKEFELLQQKIISLEKQANMANVLSLELEDMKQSYGQLRKDLVRKQEKLEQTIAENQRLHLALNETEDKLAEANLQRQQLMKKTQFLQDVNSEMQNMSETNHKLQNELRRIGELESMLSIIAEERDRLLQRDIKL